MTIYASAPESAQFLKRALRDAFPSTKFSVRLSRGTAYGYCHVGWTDGPSESQVKTVTCNFAGQGFDGMTDSTYNIPNKLSDGRETGLRGVSTSRHISASFAERCKAQIEKYFGITLPAIIALDDKRNAWRFASDPLIPETGTYASTLIHRASYDRTTYALTGGTR